MQRHRRAAQRHRHSRRRHRVPPRLNRLAMRCHRLTTRRHRITKLCHRIVVRHHRLAMRCHRKAMRKPVFPSKPLILATFHHFRQEQPAWMPSAAMRRSVSADFVHVGHRPTLQPNHSGMARCHARKRNI